MLNGSAGDGASEAVPTVELASSESSSHVDGCHPAQVTLLGMICWTRRGTSKVRVGSFSGHGQHVLIYRPSH